MKDRTRHGRSLRLLALASVIAATACAGSKGGTPGGTSRGAPDTQTSSSVGAGPVLHPPVRNLPVGENPRDLVIVGGRIWGFDFNEPKVWEFDAQGQLARSIALDAKAIAAGPTSVWLGEPSDSDTGPQGRLTEVDATSGQTLRTLTTADSVDLIAVGDGAVWTASRFSPRITRIPLSGGPQQTIPLTGTPTAITAGADGVWVAYGHADTAQAVGEPDTGAGGVEKLDPTSGSQLADQYESTPPSALALAGGTVWVALAQSNELGQISEATGRSKPIGSSVSVGNTPTDLAVGDGSVWALNYFDATVSRVDPSTGHVTSTIAFGPATDSDLLPANSPIRLAVTPGTLWVVDASANALHQLADT